ncbi:MAG: hypothetical protein ACHQPI_11550 [Thermoanaerobaculia bacterium]
MTEPRKGEPQKKTTKMGRPPKFNSGTKNLSVYLPEKTITALRQYGAWRQATSGKPYRASDIVFEALMGHEGLRDFIKGNVPPQIKRPTWDEVTGGRISELELKRK